MGNPIVRNNLLTIENYTPYCGNMGGKCDMPRTHFNGEQFVCYHCKWVSSFPDEFIKKYKEKWNIK